jgi:hypothetical protein
MEHGMLGVGSLATVASKLAKCGRKREQMEHWWLCIFIWKWDAALHIVTKLHGLFRFRI